MNNTPQAREDKPLSAEDLVAHWRDSFSQGLYLSDVDQLEDFAKWMLKQKVTVSSNKEVGAVDWEGLRERFFKECTENYYNTEYPKMRNYTPEYFFDWIKTNLLYDREDFGAKQHSTD